MRSMIRSHDIAMQLVTEHQRDLRASSAPRWRLSMLFRRRSAELEPVGPAAVSPAAGDGPGAAVTASAPAAARLGDPVTVRRGPVRPPAGPAVRRPPPR